MAKKETLSWYVKYWATEGCLLLGGVPRALSSRYGIKAHAVQRMEQVLRIQSENNISCSAEVVGSNLPPEIFPHCEGQPVQTMGGTCSFCGVKLTSLMARSWARAQAQKVKTVSEHQRRRVITIVRLVTNIMQKAWNEIYDTVEAIKVDCEKDATGAVANKLREELHFMGRNASAGTDESEWRGFAHEQVSAFYGFAELLRAWIPEEKK